MFKCCAIKRWDAMASTSGIRAYVSDRGEFTRKPILKDAAGYRAWSTKMETILDADDCGDIVMGTVLQCYNRKHHSFSTSKYTHT